MSLFTHHRRMARLLALAAFYFLFSFAQAQADDDKVVIKVMTQNQYLGADLTPVVTAVNPDDPPEKQAFDFTIAMLGILTEISANDYPERVISLAETIVKSKSHVVGLQEMWAFGCIPANPAGQSVCDLFSNAFNDHLQATMAAIDDIGGKYYVAAQSRNLAIPFAGFPLPGLPLYLDNDPIPDVYITVEDRDVILAHDRVPTEKVSYACYQKSIDGCLFRPENKAPLNLLGIPLFIERGFVAVDAVVRGEKFRVVNSHFEVRSPDPSNPASRFFQSAQANELIETLNNQPGPANSRLIVLGDFNSDPGDFPLPAQQPPYATLLSPYQQFASGLDLWGVNMVSKPYNDVWTLKRNPRPGLTCCEDADLRNSPSGHDRRVDIIYSLEKPEKVKARTLNTKEKDKTPSGLWPSDHATVVARLRFDEDDDDDDDDEDEDNENEDDDD